MKWSNPFDLIVGLETEYGIVPSPDLDSVNPILASVDLVDSYARIKQRPHWDFQGEDPFNDMRGHRIDRRQQTDMQAAQQYCQIEQLGRMSQPHSSLTDQDSVTLTALGRKIPNEEARATNVVSERGGRFYVDHAHPEVSTPECLGPIAAVWEDQQNDEIIRQANAWCAHPHKIYKNSVDQQGNTWGHHENYRIPRELPWDLLVDSLASFLALRPIYCGAGRVRSAASGELPGFAISQRAHHIQQVQGIYTTHTRPLVNARDEPHDDGKIWRRLHLIVGDPNRFAFSTYLRITSTTLWLWTVWRLWKSGETQRLRDLQLADPVSALHTISNDLSLSERLELACGDTVTALELVSAHIRLIQDVWQRNRPVLIEGESSFSEDVALRCWAAVVSELGLDKSSTADRVEWVAKLDLLERQLARTGGDWSHPSLGALDISWASLDKTKSLFARYQQNANIVQPPQGTVGTAARARLRAKLGNLSWVSKIGWTSAVIVDPDSGQQYRVPLGSAHSPVDIIDLDVSEKDFNSVLGEFVAFAKKGGAQINVKTD